MTERVQVREIDNDAGRRLLRIVRHGTRPVVIRRCAIRPDNHVTDPRLRRVIARRERRLKRQQLHLGQDRDSRHYGTFHPSTTGSSCS